MQSKRHGRTDTRLGCKSQTSDDDPVLAKMREVFVSRPGHKLVSADFSQVELRILTNISRVSFFFLFLIFAWLDTIAAAIVLTAIASCSSLSSSLILTDARRLSG
jgi:hypothetical protein